MIRDNDAILKLIDSKCSVAIGSQVFSEHIRLANYTAASSTLRWISVPLPNVSIWEQHTISANQNDSQLAIMLRMLCDCPFANTFVWQKWKMVWCAKLRNHWSCALEFFVVWDTYSFAKRPYNVVVEVEEDSGDFGHRLTICRHGPYLYDHKPKLLLCEGTSIGVTICPQCNMAIEYIDYVSFVWLKKLIMRPKPRHTYLVTL